MMSRAPEEMLVLHPLPRVDEIDQAVDEDPRAVYFEQAAGGVPVRMALIAALLGLHELPELPVTERPLQPVSLVPAENLACYNERCVTAHEPNVPYEFVALAGETVCAYCERPAARGAS